MRTGRTLAVGLIVALLLVQVSWGAKPASAAFPGDDGLIVFSSTMSAGFNNPEADFEVFIYHPILGIGQLTTNTAQDIGPSWSADGGEIVFSSDRDGNYEIYKMNANGSNPIILTTNTEYDTLPAWSPSGAYVVFVRGANEDLYVMDDDGTDQNALTNSTSRELSPNWQPLP